MKLLVTTFVVAILLLSMTPLAASSYGTTSPGHASFSPDKKPKTLTSPNAKSYGEFGYSLSTSNGLVAVGAPFEMANEYSGAGHIYIFNATSGALITTLRSPHAQSGGEFGASVSISGQLIAVGAPHESADGFSEAGNAYVFSVTSGTLISTLASANPAENGWFGSSISLSGGLVTVGAPLEKVDGYSGAGHAYVFNATTGAIVTTLTSPHAQNYGEFGISVSMAGKFVAIGASFETANEYSEAGHVYLFNALSGTMAATLTSPNVQSYGQFGWSVSLSGKLVAVGAWNETADGYLGVGHAYIFNAKSGALITALTSPNAQQEGWFGYSVSLSDKIVTVGAPAETAGGYPTAGHAYVFDAESGVQISTLTSPNTQDHGLFGYSLSMIGKRVVVGAPFEEADGQQYAGHAYIFYNV